MNRRSVVAVNRFGLGAKPGELAAVDEPEAWLRAQLRNIDTPKTGLPATAEVLGDVQTLRLEQRRQDADTRPSPDAVRRYGRVVRAHYLTQAAARYRRAALTDRPFLERLVHFWANHFAVSADKQPLPAIAGLFEDEAIRPHVTGRFADLLLAAEQHPAMLLYLDNGRSIGPNSQLGKRANRRRQSRQLGLNENLAREILELHTLGVDGGYSQTDVRALAAAITGWSLGGSGEQGRFAQGKPGTFEFRANIHEPGSKTLLNTRYSEDGLEQGVAMLRDLARHPATAAHVCRKLICHFVTDEPPAALVEALSRVYLDHDGELVPVYEALLETEASWADLQAKYKTPHDFVVSTLRALEHAPEDARFVVNALDLMGQAPWRPGSPAGWPDTALEWGGADSLYKRIEWSNTVARQAAGRVDPVDLGSDVLGVSFTDHSRTWIGRAESRRQGLTLLLASPDFQRR